MHSSPLGRIGWPLEGNPMRELTARLRSSSGHSVQEVALLPPGLGRVSFSSVNFVVMRLNPTCAPRSGVESAGIRFPSMSTRQLPGEENS